MPSGTAAGYVRGVRRSEGASAGNGRSEAAAVAGGVPVRRGDQPTGGVPAGPGNAELGSGGGIAAGGVRGAPGAGHVGGGPGEVGGVVGAWWITCYITGITWTFFNDM